MYNTNCTLSNCNVTNTNSLHTNLLHLISRKIGHVIQFVIHQIVHKMTTKKNPQV
jgi:hypothetical protein